MREINQWSQEEMAEKLAMSANGYAKIERGQGLSIDKLNNVLNFNDDMVDLLLNQDKTFFFSIGDHTNSHNVNQADKFQMLLEAKDELLKKTKKTMKLLH